MVAHVKSTAEVNLVAIDIAKQWNVVLVQEARGGRRTFKVANNRADHDQLVKYLKSLAGTIRVGFEPTGDFHRPLAYRLATEGFAVQSISSVALARMREARFGTWDKNDPKDAQVMLYMLGQGMVQTYYDALAAGTNDIQELANTYFQVTLARTRLQHSLLMHYIPLYFPEFSRYWVCTRTAWFIRFLLRFPTAAAVRELSFEAFRDEAWDLVGRKVEKRKKVAEMYALAGDSIGLPVPLDSPAIEMFRLQLSRYQKLTEERRQIEDRATELLSENKDFQRLQTLPGIGPIVALTILAEAGDLRRFEHHRQFLKYCGLDLSKSQSGQSRGREELSKRGNKRLRMALWMAALVAIHKRENAFRDKYERYLSATPLDADRKRKALTAVAAKMARVVYAVIKTGLDYERYFEQRLPSGSIPLTRAVEANATS
ncbi:MAG TPA: IS110 family transposase [Bryobacteraceae bacterium]|nr:IS110 family transposase [Bryobacteraceae bacterium]